MRAAPPRPAAGYWISTARLPDRGRAAAQLTRETQSWGVSRSDLVASGLLSDPRESECSSIFLFCRIFLTRTGERIDGATLFAPRAQEERQPKRGLRFAPKCSDGKAGGMDA
jgi:hypothetical protein